MFPLEFPLDILKPRVAQGHRVLDPFCGRGTTNFAARLLGLESLGIDSSPVAVAITAAKLVSTTVEDIVNESSAIIQGSDFPSIPEGEFWDWAYHKNVLISLCRLRTALLKDCSTPSRIALRGIVLGALHGPKQKTFASYFSNQCPRTYAPKPSYATHYWKDRNLVPDTVDVQAIIRQRAERYYKELAGVGGEARLADSRVAKSLLSDNRISQFNWVVTSPPYYGMRTYIPDQWLRNWFVGGPDYVDYSNRDQVTHRSPDIFASDLRKVWQNVASVCAEDARMVIRFGGITDRGAAPLDLIKASLSKSGWRIQTVCKAGSASEGKRQADTFLRSRSKPLEEYDLWTIRSS